MKSSLFLPNGQKSLGRSPPQELEVSLPRSLLLWCPRSWMTCEGGAEKSLCLQLNTSNKTHWYSSVQFSETLLSEAGFSIVQVSAVQPSLVQCSFAQWNSVQGCLSQGSSVLLITGKLSGNQFSAV